MSRGPVFAVIACVALTAACSKPTATQTVVTTRTAQTASAPAGGASGPTTTTTPAPGPGATSANLANDVGQTAAVSPPADSKGRLPPSPGVGAPGGVTPR